MRPHISRRGFLKLASLLSFVTPWVAGSNSLLRRQRTDASTPNILILVFDTLSALDVSLYGYRRETMPNLKRFAEQATVFHNHYAGGNFTTPGTSSILTGTYPWTHRAFSHHATVLDSFASRNLFSEFKQENYASIGFSHNLLVNILLHHFRQHLDQFTLPGEVALVDYNLADNLFKNDFGIGSQSERRHFKKPSEPSNSLFISPVLWTVKTLIDRYLRKQYQRIFPRGIPGYHDMLYPLEDTVDWIVEQLNSWPQPFFAYLHMMPPHDPYSPREEFVNIFWDGWEPVAKRDHFFADFEGRQHILVENRVYYDEYIAYVDAEFGRLHDFMHANGFYDNTIVVFTSDHGEMFERKIWKHTTPTLYEPIIRVPLVLSVPGQTARQDIFTPTSCVDILPTLLHLTNRSVPAWTEGLILPPFTKQAPPSDRSLFAIEAKSNPKFQPLRKATVAMIKGDYKMIYYRGYDGFDGVFELYNLKQDPEELDNLYPSQPQIASALQDELLTKIKESDSPYL